ncbi:MAG: DUF4127 family protein [Firmicutes bacterium]|nr:DUF4127 family protein [Bacillota bacterium]
MTIGILPLDSRSCNSIFPSSLGTFVGIECLTPPPEIMDYFFQAADCEGLISWLLETAPCCDALVISFDMLAYGGFVAARANKSYVETCLRRVGVLQQIKTAIPTLPIYAASIVLRPTITVGNKNDLYVYEKLYQYSKAAYLAEKTALPEHITEKARLVAEIPTNVLDTFLTVRKRNAAINKEAVRMAASGVLDSLLLLQEDSEPYGIQRKEQEELAKLVQQHNLHDKVTIQNGADEAGCLLTAKAFMDKNCHPLSVEIKFSCEANKNFTAMYEDRPFSENLKSSLQFLNLQNAAGAKDVLYIHNPKTAQKDTSSVYATGCSEYTEDEICAFAAEIARDTKQGRRVYLLDILYSNGGDSDIIHTLAKKMDLRMLWGYSAWNTTCNSMGTILAQLVFSQLINKRNDVFTAERILDDYLYQTVVRRKLNSAIQEMEQDPWSIENIDLANKELAKLMYDNKLLEILFRETPKFVASLPWNRTFEVSITVEPEVDNAV